MAEYIPQKIHEAVWVSRRKAVDYQTAERAGGKTVSAYGLDRRISPATTSDGRSRSRSYIAPARLIAAGA
jgi:hypothetical protein